MKTFAAGLLCFVLGVLVTLMWRDKPPQAPPPPVCPPPEACPSCAEAPKKPRPAARAARKDPAAPMPALADETEARRDRLRDWFAENGQALTTCRPDGEPRRRLLMQLLLEADGAITSATPIGAADLPPATAACVAKKVRELRVPSELLRGRETVLIHVSF